MLDEPVVPGGRGHLIGRERRRGRDRGSRGIRPRRGCRTSNYDEQRNTVKPAKAGALKLPPEIATHSTKPLRSAVFKRPLTGLREPVSTDPQSSKLPNRYGTLHSAPCTAQFFLQPPPSPSRRSPFPAPRPAPAHRCARRRTTSRLRLRYKNGPWLTKLSLPLNRHKLNAFKVCGVWNWPAGRVHLPRRRLGLPGADAPPDGAVARSRERMKRARQPRLGHGGARPEPVVKVPLSNRSPANKWGTFYYRVTLRDLAGKMLLPRTRSSSSGTSLSGGPAEHLAISVAARRVAHRPAATCEPVSRASPWRALPARRGQSAERAAVDEHEPSCRPATSRQARRR